MSSLNYLKWLSREGISDRFDWRKLLKNEISVKNREMVSEEV